MGQGIRPVWSPDGEWLAIVDARRVPKGHICLGDDDYLCPAEIYVIRPDGSGERRVTPTYEELYEAPVWSPDSRKLAFTAKGVLRVVNIDGSGLQRLKAKYYANVGSWSPDGTAIAYTEVRDHSDVYLIGLTGSRTRLTRDGRSSGPTWSPDGRWIAFKRDTPAGGLKNQLYLMRPDGSSQHALVKNGDSSDLTWSPDSRTIAYASSALLDDQVIATVEIGSGRVRQLTPYSDTSVWKSPSWSPEGAMLVVTRYGEQPRDEVWVISRSGSAKRRLVNGGDSASWQPQG
jgi:Tol biopolymer transport system component